MINYLVKGGEHAERQENRIIIGATVICDLICQALSNMVLGANVSTLSATEGPIYPCQTFVRGERDDEENKVDI